MSSLGSLYIGLSLDTVQFQNGLSKSEYQTRKFTRQFEANFSRAQEITSIRQQNGVFALII